MWVINKSYMRMFGYLLKIKNIGALLMFFWVFLVVNHALKPNETTASLLVINSIFIFLLILYDNLKNKY